MQSYHLRHSQHQWDLIKEGAERPAFTTPTKSEAIAILDKFMAGKTGSVKIHKMDGSFEEERTYPRSADPRTSQG